MAPWATPLLLLLVLLLPAPSRAASLSLLTTSSNATLPASTFPDREPIPTPDPTFLQDLIDSLTAKYRWDPDAEVRVWPLDADAALVGAVQRYEFRARAGDSVGAARVSDETVHWSRPPSTSPAVEEVSGPDGIDVVPGPGALRFGGGVRDLDLVGPFQVAVADAGLAELRLPSVSAVDFHTLPSRQILHPRGCLHITKVVSLLR
jgi:hypothetical protein